MIRNTYIDIAENDLQYLESVLKTGNTFYNQLAVQCQQVAEKFLKGYLDRTVLEEDVSDLLRKHNMKKSISRLTKPMRFCTISKNVRNMINLVLLV